MNRLQQKYYDSVAPKLAAALHTTNRFALPTLKKVIVSVSFKEEQHQDEAIKKASGWIAAITGQSPKTTQARQSIAGFGIRAGDVIGLVATLRSTRMWEFTDKIVSIALPRVRDFRGVPTTSFDGHGNYTLGLTEQIIFPEIEYDTVGKIRGLQITFVTDTGNDTIARMLLEGLGMPFEKEEIRK